MYIIINNESILIDRIIHIEKTQYNFKWIIFVWYIDSHKKQSRISQLFYSHTDMDNYFNTIKNSISLFKFK